MNLKFIKFSHVYYQTRKQSVSLLNLSFPLEYSLPHLSSVIFPSLHLSLLQSSFKCRQVKSPISETLNEHLKPCMIDIINTVYKKFEYDSSYC
jgi:hypothetical protein